MKVSGQPTLVCTLQELYQSHLRYQQGRSENLDELRAVFQGSSPSNPRFRIRCLGRDTFFNNRELLCRFVGMGTPSQNRFLQGVTDALTTHGVNRIEIAIPWSKHSTRKLQVRSGEIFSGGCDFELV